MSALAFRVEFLRAIGLAVEKQRKSLRNRGKLTMERNADGEPPEWLRIVFRRASGPFVIVELLENRRGNVYGRSNRKPDRGKVLLRLEQVALLNKPQEVVDVAVRTCTDAAYSAESSERVLEHWKSVSLNALPDI